MARAVSRMFSITRLKRFAIRHPYGAALTWAAIVPVAGSPVGIMIARHLDGAASTVTMTVYGAFLSAAAIMPPAVFVIHVKGTVRPGSVTVSGLPVQGRADASGTIQFGTMTVSGGQILGSDGSKEP